MTVTRLPDCCAVCGSWSKAAFVFGRRGKQKLWACESCAWNMSLFFPCVAILKNGYRYNPADSLERFIIKEENE